MSISTRKFLSVIIAVCMVLVSVPLRASLNADNESGVWYTYETSEGYTELTPDEPEKDVAAVFVSGSGVSLTLNEYTKSALVIVNNGATVNASSYSNADYVLLGADSSIVLSKKTLVSTDSNTGYTGTVSLSDIWGYLGDMSEDDRKELDFNYTATITANTTENDLWQKKIVVPAGKTLTISGEDGAAGSLDFDVEGNLVVNDDSWIQVKQGGSLTVSGNGSVTGIGNAELNIDQGATVSGITLNDGEQDITTPFENTESFKYDSESGKWIKDNGGQPGPEGFKIDVRYPYFNQGEGQDFTSIVYKLDNGSPIVLMDDTHAYHDISVDDLKDHTTITFIAIPSDGERTSHVCYAFRGEGDEEGWEWTDLGSIETNEYSINIADSEDWTSDLVVDIFVDGGDEGPGIEVRYDNTDFTVAYSVDGGTAKSAENHFIDASEYEDADSIVFTVTPRDELDFHADYSDQVAEDGGFINWTQLEISNNTFTLTKGDGWPEKSAIEIGLNDQPLGPGMNVGYDDTDFPTVTYALDGEDKGSVNHYIDPAIYADSSAVTFTVVPRDDMEFVAQYRYAATENDDFGNWIDLDINNNTFTLNKGDGWYAKYDINLSFPDQPQPAGMEIDLRYPDSDDGFSSITYQIDDGDVKYINVPSQHSISGDELKGHESITFNAVPKIVGSIVSAKFADDTSAEDSQQWNWSDVTVVNGSFTLDISGWTDKRYALDIYTGGDDPQPQGETFTLETDHNYGGSISVSPEALEHRTDGSREEYLYNISGYEDVVVTVLPDEGYVINSVTVDGNDVTLDENNQFGISEAPVKGQTIKVDVQFAITDAGMLNDIIEHGYAYEYSSAALFKEYLVTEIWNNYCADGGPYSIAFANQEALASALELDGTRQYDDVVGLNFYDCTFTYGTANETFRVYVLEGVRDFIVKTLVNDQEDIWEYRVVTAPSTNPDEQAQDLVIRTNPFIGPALVFGNGASVIASIQSDSIAVASCHVTQERSGLDIGPINTRFIIVQGFEGSTPVVFNGSEDCVAWDFGNLNTYPATSSKGEAIESYAYIDSASVKVSKTSYYGVNDETTLTNVTLDESSGLKSDIVDIAENSDGSFTITFNSMYDEIPLVLTLSDGSTKYITLKRTALRITKKSVNTGNNPPTVELPHGAYSTEDREIPAEFIPSLGGGENVAIVASYYSQSSIGDNIRLFVTFTMNDGTTETKFIESPVATGTAESNDPNNQYTNNYADYIFWAGPEGDYSQIRSVEVIVYKDGSNEDSFGGVMIGSGRGVLWQRPAY